MPADRDAIATIKATAATWVVDDMDDVVMKAAWFKDPDGNILALVGS